MQNRPRERDYQESVRFRDDLSNGPMSSDFPRRSGFDNFPLPSHEQGNLPDMRNPYGGGPFSTQLDPRSQQPFTSKRAPDFEGGYTSDHISPHISDHSPIDQYPPSFSSSLSASQRRSGAIPLAPPPNFGASNPRAPSPAQQRRPLTDEPIGGERLESSTRGRSATPKGGRAAVGEPDNTDFHGMDDPLRASMRPLSSATPVSQQAAGNSKAVLSAMRALQDKIRKLESEKAYYQENYEVTRRSAAEFREEVQKTLENEQKRYKETVKTLEIENEALIRERSDLSTALSASRDQTKTLDADLTFLRQTCESMESDKKVLQARVEELSKMVERMTQEYGERNRDMEARLAQLTASNAELQERLRAAEISLTTERQTRDHIEQERNRLSVATKEMVLLNQSLKDKLQNYEVIMASGADFGAESGEIAVAKPVVKKKKVVPKKSESGKPTTTTSDTRSSISSSTSAMRPRSAEKSRRSSISGGGQGTTSTSLHEKLKKANKAEVPFILSKGGKSFNVAGVVQSSLARSSRRSSQVEEPAPCEQEVPEITEDEMDEVIRNLESEYIELNEQYHKLLTRASQTDILTHDRYDITGSLKSILDRLEQKSEQLANCRRYKEFKIEQLREALAPPFVRGSEKRTKILKLLQDIKNVPAF